MPSQSRRPRGSNIYQQHICSPCSLSRDPGTSSSDAIQSREEWLPHPPRLNSSDRAPNVPVFKRGNGMMTKSKNTSPTSFCCFLTKVLKSANMLAFLDKKSFPNLFTNTHAPVMLELLWGLVNDTVFKSETRIPSEGRRWFCGRRRFWE